LKNFHILGKKAVANSVTMEEFFGNNNVVMVNGETWKNQRHTINPLFGNLSIFKDPMVNKSYELLDKIEENVDISYAIGDDLQKMTLDVLGVCLLGEDFKFLQGGNEGPLKWYNNIMKSSTNHPLLLSPSLSMIPSKVKTQIKDDIKKFNDYLKNKIAETQANPNNDKNLFNFLVEAIKEKSFNYGEVRDNLITFFVAGHETTSASLLFCLYFLAKYPEIQAKLREEIIKVLPNNEINFDAVKDINYLTNFIHETLRICPPASYLVGRVALQDTEVDGWVLPKGFQLVINIWLMHHDINAWGEDVEVFNPDRFQNLTPLQKRCFMPFGAGPRICLGNQFSMTEQKLFLVAMLKKFSIIATEDSQLELSPSIVLSPNTKKLKFIFKHLE